MKKFFAKAFAAGVVLLATMAAVAAADLPVKALPIIGNSCSNTGCTGFNAGLNMGGVGQGVNIANLGEVNAGGQYMGFQGGYQVFNGLYQFGPKVELQYEVYAPTVQPVSGLSNKLFAFEGIELGGNLSQLFNITPITLPGWLSTAVPFADVGGCQHGSLSGWCVGTGAKFYIPATRWSLDLEYINAQYGRTTISPGQTTSVENRGNAAIVYHF